MKKILCIGMLLTGLGLFLAPLVMALSIGFDPADQFVNVGDMIDVDIVATNLAEGEIITAFDLEMLYDPHILNAASVNFGSGLNGGIPPLFIQELQLFGLPLPQEFDIDNEKGLVDIRETSLMSDGELALWQKNLEPFTLATIFFDVIAMGTSPLGFSLEKSIIVGKEATPLSGVSFGKGSIAAVPEPATLLLLGAGLAGLAGFRRKKFKPKTQ